MASAGLQGKILNRSLMGFPRRSCPKDFHTLRLVGHLDAQHGQGRALLPRNPSQILKNTQLNSMSYFHAGCSAQRGSLARSLGWDLGRCSRMTSHDADHSKAGPDKQRMRLRTDFLSYLTFGPESCVASSLWACRPAFELAAS